MVIMNRFWPVFFLILLPQIVLAQVFTRDLYFGLRNDSDVARLQDFLREQNFFSYPVSTGNFFTVTLESVKKFQRAQKVKPPMGYFGPLSRVKANAILASKPPVDVAIPPVAGSSATSNYYNKIFFTVRGNSIQPEDELVEITNRDRKESIDVTGWTIKNTQNHSFEIPLVHNLPGSYDIKPTDRLILPPGGRITISVGKQERRINFQENLCTGYFAQTSEFNPSISSSCPQLDTRSLSAQFTDRCVKLMERIPSCTAPSFSYKDTAGLENECTDFINQNFSYTGCVKNFRNQPNFFEKHWLIWIQSDEEFFRNTHDTVILRDSEGKLVGEKSY